MKCFSYPAPPVNQQNNNSTMHPDPKSPTPTSMTPKWHPCEKYLPTHRWLTKSHMKFQKLFFTTITIIINSNLRWLMRQRLLLLIVHSVRSGLPPPKIQDRSLSNRPVPVPVTKWPNRPVMPRPIPWVLWLTNGIRWGLMLTVQLWMKLLCTPVPIPWWVMMICIPWPIPSMTPVTWEATMNSFLRCYQEIWTDKIRVFLRAVGRPACKPVIVVDFSFNIQIFIKFWITKGILFTFQIWFCLLCKWTLFRWFKRRDQRQYQKLYQNPEMFLFNLENIVRWSIQKLYLSISSLAFWLVGS